MHNMSNLEIRYSGKKKKKIKEKLFGYNSHQLRTGKLGFTLTKI